MLSIDPDGYKLSALFLIGAVVLWAMYFVMPWPVFSWTALVFVLLTAFSLYFFRDPERTPPENQGAVSAADGVVVDIATVDAEGFEGGKALRIAVFMNVFNVHVNRIPVAGTVIRTSHYPGRKLSAFNRRAEQENEHADTDIIVETGFKPVSTPLVRVRQIAGLIARRVVTRVRVGESLERGDRIGLIRFGSRVDVFFTESYIPAVTKGERVRAGESIIARLADTTESEP